MFDLKKGDPMRGQQTHLSVYLILLFVLGLVFPMVLQAEFYRYRGADGTIHFTDDLNQVPLDQREKMESYTGVQPPSTPAPATETDAAKETLAPAAERAKEAVDFIETQRQALVTRQAALQTEYEGLMKTRAEIETLRQSADTTEKQDALRAKITALQTDIAAYETKTKALEADVNAFNAAIEATPPLQDKSQ